MKGRNGRAPADRLSLAREIQFPREAPAGAFRMQVHEPDGLVRGRAAGTGDPCDRDGYSRAETLLPLIGAGKPSGAPSPNGAPSGLRAPVETDPLS